MSFLYEKSLSEIRSQLLAKELTVTEVVEACIKRIEETEPSIQALISVQAEEAREQARAMDAAGPDASKPLWGVPLTVKDLLCTKGTKRWKTLKNASSVNAKNSSNTQLNLC